jgi:hypothetical protein
MIFFFIGFRVTAFTKPSENSLLISILQEKNSVLSIGFV